MQQAYPIREVVDLTDSSHNMLLNMSTEEARQRVASGDVEAVRQIEGHFALVARPEHHKHLVRMARSLSVPLRYFVAKKVDGPSLVAAHRMDTIQQWLQQQNLADQFHPTYTRMAPAHYITEIALIGCPDPSPKHSRFFAPKRETLKPEPRAIGRQYIEAVQHALRRWLKRLPQREPIGVCFSGGIDSGAVFLLTYHLMLELGMNPSRLKAFTLSVDGGGDDMAQARSFLETLDLSIFHEPVEVPADWIDCEATVRLVEDYKPLDVQAATVISALCRGIRQRYPAWKYLLDGDGGDENLKDYPIEENPELTIRSVLNNSMLYQEGWGVESLKHSMVYSGGLSRGATRTFAPLTAHGFRGFSPFMLPNVIEVAEGIPFIAMTDWSHDRLYRLKGEIVSAGIETVTGMHMPIFPKRRFQHGAVTDAAFAQKFPSTQRDYRRVFFANCDG